MSTYHTVQQGEHLSGIAERYGFHDYRTIWNHPQNAGLRQKRQNPSVLFPGDRVFIQDKELKEEVRVTEKRHRFRTGKPPLRLRLLIEDQYEKPVVNAPCTLTVGSRSLNVTTDSQGRIEQDLPADAQVATLTIVDPETPLEAVEIPIAIGELDPTTEFSGQRARLANLAYLLDNLAVETSEAFKSAVEEFQCENGLTVDGVCGAATQAKLKTIHGC